MTAPSRRNGAAVSTIIRGCESKRRFPDRIEAMAVGLSLSEETGSKTYVYRCSFCCGWHLTRNRQGASNAVDFYIKQRPSGR